MPGSGTRTASPPHQEPHKFRGCAPLCLLGWCRYRNRDRHINLFCSEICSNSARLQSKGHPHWQGGYAFITVRWSMRLETIRPQWRGDYEARPLVSHINSIHRIYPAAVVNLLSGVHHRHEPHCHVHKYGGHEAQWRPLCTHHLLGWSEPEHPILPWPIRQDHIHVSSLGKGEGGRTGRKWVKPRPSSFTVYI